MSDLKWKTLEQLEEAKAHAELEIADFERMIRKHKRIIGQATGKQNSMGIRLSWINHYIRKSPVKMTLAEIEQQLGHKVTIEVST